MAANVLINKSHEIPGQLLKDGVKSVGVDESTL